MCSQLVVTRGLNSERLKNARVTKIFCNPCNFLRSHFIAINVYVFAVYTQRRIGNFFINTFTFVWKGLRRLCSEIHKHLWGLVYFLIYLQEFTHTYNVYNIDWFLFRDIFFLNIKREFREVLWKKLWVWKKTKSRDKINKYHFIQV